MSSDDDFFSDPLIRYERAVLETEEYAPLNVSLADLMVGGRLDIYPDVLGKRFFNVYLKNDALVFQAGGYVGLIPINDRISIDVKPRVPVRNLERIIRIARHTPVSLSSYTRGYGIDIENIPSLVDILVDSLLESIESIRAHGVFQEYSQQHDDTSFPRGRILLSSTLRKHHAVGARHRVSASWFERSRDNALNQCVKYAIWYLAQRYKAQKPGKGTVARLSALNRAYRLFADATLDKSRMFLKNPLVAEPQRIPSLRAYYRRAIYLATTIITERGISFEVSRDEIVTASLLIHMEALFEEYLRAVLESRLPQMNSDIFVLDGNKAGVGGGKKFLFDQGHADDIASTTEAKPDIVCSYQKPNSDIVHYPMIIDAKYKVVRWSSDREDMEQVITYALSYSSPYVLLIHPCINKKQHGLRALGRIKSLKVFQYMVDLSAPDLEEEERMLAEQVYSLLSGVVNDT